MLSLNHVGSPSCKSIHASGRVPTHSHSHSSATKITSSPSHSTAHPSNQSSTHSHSANTYDKTLSPSHSKLLKRAHSPSHKTAHNGNQISTHGGEHLLSHSQVHVPERSHCDGSASSSSLSSTVKTALSQSHRANKQVSAHTHSHGWEQPSIICDSCLTCRVSA